MIPKIELETEADVPGVKPDDIEITIPNAVIAGAKIVNETGGQWTKERIRVKVAVASSSMNCQFILEKTGLDSLFEDIVGGIVSRELELKGKPEPEIFLVAAENIGVDPGSSILVEDAVSGVEAGRRGNFAVRGIFKYL